MSVFSVARGCEGFHLRVYGDGPVLSDVKRYFRPDAESGQAAWALPGNDMRTISPRGVRSRSSISPPWPLTTSRAIDSPRPNPLRFAELRALSPLKNGSNTFSRNDEAIPGPSSATSISTAPSFRVRKATVTSEPCLTALSITLLIARVRTLGRQVHVSRPGPS